MPDKRAEPVAYAGARGRADPGKLKEAASRLSCELFLVDASLVFGHDHVESAIFRARRAFRTGRAAARTIAVEVVRYMSGERQISAAISKMRSGEDVTRHVLVIAGACGVDMALGELALERDNECIAGGFKDVVAFGITKKELESVPAGKASEIVLERVALLDLEK